MTWMSGMTIVDWVIVVIMVIAVLSGMAQGFFRSFCSLAGLVMGLAIASWNYGRIAVLLMPLVRIHGVADAIAFLVIALLVMAIFAIAGAFLSKAFQMVGLGCLDGFAGAIFGFFEGVIMVTLGIVVIVAFFPQAHVLDEARLPRLFFGACHLSMHMSPAELAERVRSGLNTLEEESPGWLHSKHS